VDGSSQVVNPFINVVTSFDIQLVANDGTVSIRRVVITVDMKLNRTITLDEVVI
jgi:hypothetical protein